MKAVLAAFAVVLAWTGFAAAQPRPLSMQVLPDAPAAAAVTGFTHAGAIEAGAYLADHEQQAGSWRIARLTISSFRAFARWETSGRRGPAPVTIQFANVTSPRRTGRDGLTGYTVTETVQPDAYFVDREHVSFRGHGPRVGAVTFAGVISRQRDLDPNLRGRLTVGDQAFEDVSFTRPRT